ncbi:hypothetical protein ACWF8U_20485 [Streptomyces olivaceus]
MTDRIPLDDLTSDQLDALYDQLAAAQERAENFEGRAAAFERRHATLKRAHIALAEQAGRDQAALARVHHLADLIHAGAPWLSNHTETATRIRAAITGPNTTEK